MSSKANRMAANLIEQPKQKVETVEIMTRVNVAIEDNDCNITDKSKYILISGVPKNLPPEMEPTVIRTAEANFINALSSRMFMEFYNLGKSSKDEQPEFINMSLMKKIKIKSIEKVEKIESK